jgi:hypothetical protein
MPLSLLIESLKSVGCMPDWSCGYAMMLGLTTSTAPYLGKSAWHMADPLLGPPPPRAVGTIPSSSQRCTPCGKKQGAGGAKGCWRHFVPGVSGSDCRSSAGAECPLESSIDVEQASSLPKALYLRSLRDYFANHDVVRDIDSLKESSFRASLGT